MLIITKCCGQTILTWRKIAKDKTAPMHLCNKKNLSNKNCRGAEDKKIVQNLKKGQTEMETRTGHKENINGTGSLIASSDPSMSANQVVTLINCKIICKPSSTPPFNVSKILKHILFSKIGPASLSPFHEFVKTMYYLYISKRCVLHFRSCFPVPNKMPGHAFHRIVS